MLRYGIPQYRLPKVEVLEAEYESVTRLGGKIVCNAGLGRDFTLDDLQTRASTRSASPSAATTQQAGHPRRGRRRRARRPRVPAHRDPRPAVPGPRRARASSSSAAASPSMDCSRTSVRQGASEVTLVYRRDMKDMPAANEVHEAIEEGAPAIFQAAPDARRHRRATASVTGVEFQRMALGEPDASGRRRPEPVPGTEFIIHCDRVLLAIGQGPELAWIEPGADGVEATKQPPARRGRGHLRDRPARRLRHRRRAHRRGDRRPGHGRGPARRLRRRRLPAGPRPRRHPDAPDARRAAARVPVHRALHRARSRSRATG